MGWALILSLVVYVIVGQKLSRDAFHYLRNPRRRYFYTPLLSPEEFMPEGEHMRRRAVRFMYGGAAVIAVLAAAEWIASH